MAKIEFKNLPDTTTPLNATNLNTIQEIVEEGQWTPTIVALNETAPTVTYIERTGKYKKIGNIVFVNFCIRAQITAVNGTNNYAVISGLPYSEISSGFGAQTINIGQLYSAIYSNDNAAFNIYGSTIRIQNGYGSGAAKWIVTPTNYMEVAGNGFYFVA